MSVIIRKLNAATYPGFDTFKAYFESCSQDWLNWPGKFVIKNNEIHIQGSADWMTTIFNRPEFRLLWSLLPAGTDIRTAFHQMYALKYRKEMGLEGESGTYTLRIATHWRVLERQNEAQLSQEHLVRYEMVGGDTTYEVTVGL
ncbi:hypothetical protein GCM10023347_50830 [Streptomyces chumphonensis]|uniref:Uncharacterized protein n=1 Tax=Streptomyces chumphonensis TaxID=1214925 RepID=A0A927F2D0_9ACTN|nr:hypothetical protein [Streptomyces chumphonensis]MBD3933447.1 hypothetical protein [Streptomyces chumphonensis]